MSDQTPNVAALLDRFKALPLTGRVISVLPNIPCVIGVNDEGKLKIAHIPEKTSLKAAISGITAAGWDHTIVAWTGEVVTTDSDAFQQLLKRDDKRYGAEEIIYQFDDFTIDPTKRPPKYWREFSKAHKSELEWDISIDTRAIGELDTILKGQFKEEIIPVWFVTYDESGGRIEALAADAPKLRGTTSAMLYQTLHDAGRTGLDRAYSEMNFDYYERLNKYVAFEIIKTYQPGDIIWIHTHQHMLLPGILRKKLPAALIIYAQNEQWASEETLPKLHKHKQLTVGLLGATTIAVPTAKVLNELTAYHLKYKEFGFERVEVKYPGHHWDIKLAPVGLNLEDLREAIKAKGVLHQVQTLRSVYFKKRTIFARARADQLKGILVVLGAFRHLLRTSPEWVKEVFLFISITPNRLPAYKYLDGDVTLIDFYQAILDTNSTYGSASYVPVIYLGGNGSYLPRNQYLALLRIADVGIAVNNQAFANDMSREFVVAQEGNCSPLLIATWDHKEKDEEPEKAEGIARIMYGDFFVNPEHYSEPASRADALLRDALTMTEAERKQRQRRLFDHFAKPVVPLTKAIIIEMAEMALQRKVSQGPQPLPVETMIKVYAKAESSLLILDYDGTLTPIVNNPDHAVPTESLLEDLKDLAELPGNKVYIVSGRSREFLQKHFGSIPALGLSAEHGCFFKEAGDALDKWVDNAGNTNSSWKGEVESMLIGLEEVYKGSYIERKEVAIVWDYRNVTSHTQKDCRAKAEEIMAILVGEEFKHLNLAIMLGSANFEARPKSISKGDVVNMLLSAAFEEKVDNRFVFCAGDDTTDEGKHEVSSRNAFVC